MKQEIEDIKQEVKEIEQKGLASEIIIGLKSQCKRKDIIIMMLIVCWLITGIYLVYTLNDIGTSEVTTTETYDQDIKDTGDIDNTTINNGGVINGND